MEAVRPAHTTIRFGAFELDRRAGELRKGGVRVKLPEQPLEILQILLEHPGEIVMREEIQHRLWPSDTFVDFEHGLYNAIKRVREALGDSAEDPRFIETIPKRGYRFIGSVNGSDGSIDAEVAGTRKEVIQGSWRTAWIGGIAALAGLATAVTIFSLNTFRIQDRVFGPPVRRIESLAVLPLANLSDDPAQEYFSEGITDGLITDLAQIGSVRVISRTSSMQYKQTQKSLPQIARELNVDGIIEGTVQRSGDRVRITIQLIRASSDEHVWANSYERDVRDVLGLERDVTGEIAREVQARLTTGNQVTIAKAKAVDPNVLDAYLQGNYHLNRFSRGSGDEELRKAGEYFQQAIDADANFAPAYIGMAEAHRGKAQSSNEDTLIARKAAEKAVQLNPTLAEAWAALAKIKFDHWEWPGAEEDYRQAITHSYNNATAHEGLCDVLDDMGQLDSGLLECQIAQQIDPNADHMSYALMKRREYDRAIEVLLIMLERDPNNGYIHHTLYDCYAAKGMYKEAVQHLERVFELFGFPELAGDLRRAYAASGYLGAMQWYAKELEHLQATNQLFLPVNVAAVYTFLGDKDRALYWLEQAYKYPGRGNAGVELTEINVYPPLAPLRSDPRFKNLARRIGLPH